jgi:hypothetical protein
LAKNIIQLAKNMALSCPRRTPETPFPQDGEAVPAGPEDFGHTVLVTRNFYTVEHKPGTEGKRVACCGAFQNSKGEKGDWGDIVVAVCP